MRAFNASITRSLSPVVCMIFFCSYIITTKEVHPYAEESILYLNNISNSILDATINAKDFSYYALPVHLLFRIGPLLQGDPLYWARLISIAFVIYAVYRLFKLGLENISISSRKREIISATGILGMLFVIFSTSSENLATFNIPYFYGLISLGQMINALVSSKNSYSKEKAVLISFENIIDSLLMLIMALSKPLVITFVISSIAFNCQLLIKGKNGRTKICGLRRWKSLAIFFCSVVSIVFTLLTIVNILNNASGQGTVNSNTDLIKFFICFMLTYIVIWISEKHYSRIYSYSSQIAYKLPNLFYKLQEHCFVFAIPFTIYANITLGRNIFAWDAYMNMFYDRKIIPIGLVLIYIIFKLLYASSVFAAQSNERVVGRIINMRLTIVSLIVTFVPIIDKLTGSTGLLNFSSHILNNSVSSYRDVVDNGLNCFLPSPNLWGALSKMSFSSPSSKCFMEAVGFSEMSKSNLLVAFEDNYFLEVSPNSLFFDHSKTKGLTAVKCTLFDQTSGIVFYSGRKNIPENQKKTTLVFRKVTAMDGIPDRLSCNLELIPESMKNRKFFRSISIINEST